MINYCKAILSLFKVQIKILHFCRKKFLSERAFLKIIDVKICYFLLPWSCENHIQIHNPGKNIPEHKEAKETVTSTAAIVNMTSISAIHHRPNTSISSSVWRAGGQLLLLCVCAI